MSGLAWLAGWREEMCNGLLSLSSYRQGYTAYLDTCGGRYSNGGWATRPRVGRTLNSSTVGRQRLSDKMG